MAEAPVSAPHAHEIKLELDDVSQLFNSMDPSPFHHKDLDHDAEEFITSWAQEYPRRAPLMLKIYLNRAPAEANVHDLVGQAIHNYFAYRADLTRREFRQLLRQGRLSLIIGVVFLAACFGVAELLSRFLAPGPLTALIKESIFIGGWVAMWRPLEIFLYDWWPLRRRWVIFEKMASMPVEVVLRSQRQT